MAASIAPVTAGSVTMAGDSQHFMLCCGVHSPCDGATCLAAQKVSRVSLPALRYSPWALALANGPGVHCFAIEDGDKQLLGYHRPFS